MTANRATLDVVWGIAILSAVSGCSEAPLRLVEDPARRAIVQRKRMELPGSGGRFSIKLGDITHGQVLLAIIREDGNPLLHQRSVRQDDVIEFTIGGEVYYLKVTKLRNFLAGDDFAVVEVSTHAPDKPPAQPAIETPPTGAR